jgi:hypothetical protein
MARRKKPKTPASNDQTSTQKIWTLQDHQEDLPYGVLALTTSDMDDT